MTILQAGMAKSGNYWLYRIIQSGLRRSGQDPRSFIENHPIYETARTWELSVHDQASIDVMDIDEDGCSFRISSRFREEIADIEKYVESSSHVWTHSYFNAMSEEVLPLFSRIVYVVRDPRDVLISLSHFMFTDYMREYYPHDWPNRQAFLRGQLTSHQRRWTRHVAGYLAHAERLGIHVVFFERLRRDFQSECSSLLKYLGLPHDEVSISEIERQVQVDRMKERNPAHVRKGTSGGWQQELDAPTLTRSEAVAGPLLDILGYPVGSYETDGRALPVLPSPLPVAALRSLAENASSRRAGFFERLLHRFRRMATSS